MSFQSFTCPEDMIPSPTCYIFLHIIGPNKQNIHYYKRLIYWCTMFSEMKILSKRPHKELFNTTCTNSRILAEHKSNKSSAYSRQYLPVKDTLYFGKLTNFNDLNKQIQIVLKKPHAFRWLEHMNAVFEVLRSNHWAKWQQGTM